MPAGLIGSIYRIDVPRGMSQFISRFKANQIRNPDGGGRGEVGDPVNESNSSPHRVRLVELLHGYS